MKRELIVIAAAVFMGIAAVVFYQLRIESMEEELRSQLKDKVSVCALAQGVGARQMLTAERLKQTEVPRAFLHPRAVKWTDRAEIIGQRVLVPMQADQVVLWSDLEERSRRSVDDSIPPGRAVVTLPIDMVGGVGGLVSPGSRVDLFGIFRSLPFGEAKERVQQKLKTQVQSIEELNAMLGQVDQITETLSGGKRAQFYVVPVASNLGVFAVGGRTQASGGQQEEGYSTISFDVPLTTQILLIMAAQKVDAEGGKLICALRSSQAGGEALEKPGQVYSADEFLKLIPQAHAEVQENR